MSAIKEFNSLGGKVVSREELEALNIKAFNEVSISSNSYQDKKLGEVCKRVIAILNKYPNAKEFEFEPNAIKKIEENSKLGIPVKLEVHSKKMGENLVFFYGEKMLATIRPNGLIEYETSKLPRGAKNIIRKASNNLGLNAPVDENMLHGLELLPDNEDYGLGKPVSQNEIYDNITKLMINTIKEVGHLPWQKEWNGSGIIGAKNFVTGKPYTGVNFFTLNFVTKYDADGKPYLVAATDEPQYFLTFNQIETLGGKIKKGARARMVVYYNFILNYKDEKVSFSGTDADKFADFAKKNNLSETDVKKGLKRFPILKYYNVFNSNDVDGLPAPPKQVEKNINPNYYAQFIIDNYPNKPDYRFGSPKAFYVPSGDYVSMPFIKAFKKESSYYSTFFHEIVHSTGHKSRLNRDMSGSFGNDKYAFEELIAELGATYLCAETGILFETIDNSAKYLKGWSEKLISKMEEDNKFFMRAAAQAQKATNYILDTENPKRKKYTGKKPKAVTEKPKTVTKKPKTVTKKPKTVTKKPKTVTKKLENVRIEKKDFTDFKSFLKAISNKTNELKKEKTSKVCSSGCYSLTYFGEVYSVAKKFFVGNNLFETEFSLGSHGKRMSFDHKFYLLSNLTHQRKELYSASPSTKPESVIIRGLKKLYSDNIQDEDLKIKEIENKLKEIEKTKVISQQIRFDFDLIAKNISQLSNVEDRKRLSKTLSWLSKRGGKLHPVELEEINPKPFDKKPKSASIQTAIKDILSLDKYKGEKILPASLFYNHFKNSDEDEIEIEIYSDYEIAILEKAKTKLFGFYQLKYTGLIEITDFGRDFIKSVNGRLESLRNQKHNYAMFDNLNSPEKVNGKEVITYRWYINDDNRKNAIYTLTKKGDKKKYFITFADFEKYRGKGLYDIDMVLKIEKSISKKIVKVLNQKSKLNSPEPVEEIEVIEPTPIIPIVAHLPEQQNEPVEQENISVVEPAQPVERKSRLMSMVFETLPMKGKFANLMQHPAKNLKIGIFGKPKNGKTAGSLQLAEYLTQFGNVLYNFADQGFNLSTQMLWKESGLAKHPENVAYPSDASSLDELEKEIATGKYQFVFIDLINDYIDREKISPQEFKDRFIRKYDNIGFILVFESTKNGDFKGDQKWMHVVDAIANVEDFIMTMRGRYGNGDYLIWEQGLKDVNPKRYQEWLDNNTETIEPEEIIFSDEIEII